MKHVLSTWAACCPVVSTKGDRHQRWGHSSFLKVAFALLSGTGGQGSFLDRGEHYPAPRSLEMKAWSRIFRHVRQIGSSDTVCAAASLSTATSAQGRRCYRRRESVKMTIQRLQCLCLFTGSVQKEIRNYTPVPKAPWPLQAF